MNRRVIVPGDQEWPERLKELSPHDSPKKLYVEGAAIESDALMVAIVGTRHPTASGVEAAQDIARGLAEAGITIVSGLAMGIDSVAHRATLEVGGRTIAVLGCGLDVVYPKRNVGLRRQISATGSVISEYEDHVQPTTFTFPRRNRIIAGMSEGVVFVEGGAKSGGRITARVGLEENRSVFAVPGSIRNPMSAGPNGLIRQSEARLITCFEDVLEEVAPGLVWEKCIGVQRGPAPEMTEDERAVLFFVEETPVAPERIRNHLNFSTGRAALSLARLEARGWVMRRGAGYVLTDTGTRVREAVVAREELVSR